VVPVVTFNMVPPSGIWAKIKLPANNKRNEKNILAIIKFLMGLKLIRHAKLTELVNYNFRIILNFTLRLTKRHYLLDLPSKNKINSLI
jgi:hypothetical protein